MPIYSYKTEDGEVIDEVFSLKERPETITLKDGRVANRIFAVPNIIGNDNRPGWPIVDFAAGVSAEQAGDLRKTFKDHHVSAEVTNDGDVVWHNSRERKKGLKALNMFDRASFD